MKKFFLGILATVCILIIPSCTKNGDTRPHMEFDCEQIVFDSNGGSKTITCLNYSEIEITSIRQSYNLAGDDFKTQVSSNDGLSVTVTAPATIEITASPSSGSREWLIMVTCNKDNAIGYIGVCQEINEL